MKAMGKREAAERIARLRVLIDRARYQYHVLDQQAMSDEALDSLKDELVRLETQFPDLITPDSPTQRVAGAPSAQFTKVHHRVAQWSFNDAFTTEDILAFDERVKKALDTEPNYTTELKIDGFKIVLTYQSGLLVTAATRGDGETGEEVTANVRTIESIPLRLTEPVDLIVEGEIWLSKNQFEKLNQERKRAGEALYANPRNVAAGTIRQLDSRLVASRRLDSFIYDLAEANFPLPATQGEELAKLQSLGFKVNPHFRHAANIQGVIAYWQNWEKKKEELDYKLDGVVVKVDERRYQEQLGYTGKAPRFAIALKFRAEEATTVVEKIELQVGRMGTVTPVAHLRPVFLDGSTVSRATLHNEDEIKRLDVRLGDTVIIRKAGDIIPDIVAVLPELRPKHSRPYIFPKYLPKIGKIKRVQGMAAHRVADQYSKIQRRRQFHHFVSKHAFDILHCGPKMIDLLFEHRLVSSFADIFTLQYKDLIKLPRLAEKSVKNLLTSIENSRQISLSRFLVSLSIPQVGEETAEDLARHFGDIKKLSEAELADLEKITNVGPIVARSVYDWFRESAHQKLVRDLLKQVIIRKEAKSVSGKLKGLTFVLTGTMMGMGRDEARQRIKMLGGSVAATVSKNTTYLVAGDNPGSKLDKAEELEVKILSENEFLKLLN